MLPALAAELGFATPPLPLDRNARVALGLGEPPIRDAAIAPGSGALRALLVECDPGAPLRDVVSAAAARLSARAPHLLWLLIAAQRDGPELAIAAWCADRSRPRVSALLVDRTHVVASDAETVNALAGLTGASDLITHAGWLEVLGREALTRRFYRALERVVGELAREAVGRASAEERSELALLHVSRLLFLSFLETKGWLNGEPRFLERTFARCMERGGDYHGRVLLPLFFGTLNTPPEARAKAARALGRIPFLNGGLFARTALERRRRDVRFPDAAIGLVLGELLGRYRFTAREETSAWSEAAIDPEMLGKAFESLMEAGERRASGAFFTPHALVAGIARAALVEALAGGAAPASVVEGALRGERPADAAARTLGERVVALRVLDPACGSGAFLVHVLETVGALRACLGDPRPVADVRREVLTRSIFGVDVNPTAVWLCELRLWLSVVIESGESDPLAVTPLPNLDRHIRVGDSLSGVAFDDVRPRPGGAYLARLRDRYARAAGARKRTLERALDAAERAFVIAHLEDEQARCADRRRDLIAALRGRDLFGERIRVGAAERARLDAERARARELQATLRRVRGGGALPFAWVTHFPDVARLGGFDIVLGNPPWVRLHRIPASARAALRERYAVFRDASWARGATAARATPGFAAQVDVAALFTERSLALLRPGGTLALLLPAKLWHSLAGGGVRRLLATRTRLVALDDWSESPPTFDAAVYPSVLVARRHELRAEPATLREAPGVTVTLHRKCDLLRWEVPRARLALDDDPASPWLAIPPLVREGFDRMVRAGLPLAESALGAPQLGVKCGCNEAFIVRVTGGDGPLAAVRSGDIEGVVERTLLRPLLRGEAVVPWRAVEHTEWILWTHDDTGAPLRTLPPHAARWLARWRDPLAARADARGGTPWWALFRTSGAANATSRVVWADVGRTPRALVLAPGDATVPLNSCYVLPCRDPAHAHALAALLNSSLVAAWLNAIAEPARGGYRRYLGWTVALLPVPRDWSRACAALAPLAEQAARGEPPPADALLVAALRAYRLRADLMAPLLAWCAR